MTLYIYPAEFQSKNGEVVVFHPEPFDMPLASLETMRVWAKRKGKPDDLYVIENNYRIEETGYVKNLDVSIDMPA
jgi:hypothetical protein